MDAKQIIDTLGMERHPEGGWFKETYRDPDTHNGRAVSTAIYFLLKKGDRSHWHRVDATEIWHYYAGDPLELSLSPDGETQKSALLGPNLLAGGQLPQIVVPKGHWQAAESTGEWTLVGCTVAPGFEFSGFVLAPPEWSPGWNRAG